MVIETVRAQIKLRIEALDQDISDIEEARGLAEGRQVCQKADGIPGVELLTATAAVATWAMPRHSRTGRSLPPSWVWCRDRPAPADGEALGHQQAGRRISAHTLIHGARAVITHAKEREPWLEKLLERRPLNAAVVALANKMARA